MNRRLLSAVLVVAVVGTGAVGAYTALSGGADATPETPETPTATPVASPTVAPTATPDGPVELATGEDGRLVFETAEGQAVRGETTLDPGTTLLVRLKSTDSAHPFLHSAETEVGSDGTFEATFDLSAVEGSGTFDVVVRRDDEVLLTSTGRLEDTGSDADVTGTSADGTETPADGSEREADDGPYVSFVTADRGDLVLRATEDQVVRGETALPAGTEFVVRLRSSGENPFMKTATATVESDGTFRARFNASGLEPGTPFEAAALRDDETLATAAGEVVAGDPDVEAAFAYEGERLTLANATGQVVHGETDLAAGETVLVRMHSGGATPFIKSREVTVRENGIFDATFDMSNVPEGTTFRAFVSHDGERLTEAPGEVATDA